MTDDMLPLSFPAVGRKKITAAFDGGRITSDGGVMLLAAAERRLGSGRPARRRHPRSARPGTGDAYWPTSCAPASLRLPAATRTLTTSIACAPIRPSSWPAGGCPTVEWTCARSRPARGWRTFPTSGPSSGSAARWSTYGCRAMPHRQRSSRSTSMPGRADRQPGAISLVEAGRSAFRLDAEEVSIRRDRL